MKIGESFDGTEEDWVHGRSNFQRGRRAAEAGDWELAERLFRESARLQAHPKTLYLLGIALLRLGRETEAVPYLAAGALLTAIADGAVELAELLEPHDSTHALRAARRAVEGKPLQKRAKAIRERLEAEATRRRLDLEIADLP